jgi:hypothetical protein
MKKWLQRRLKNSSSIVRSRERSKKTIGQTVKRVLEINSPSLDQIHDNILWCQLIHVDNLI